LKEPTLASEVESGLDDIWLYSATESGSTEIATRLVEAITGRFPLLAEDPFSGRSRDHDLRVGLRSFAVEKYVILYRIEGDSAIILHVMHGSRDRQRWN